MRKLRIGITCYPSLGGSGVVATELGILLAERGHDVHFITSGRPFRLYMDQPNITVHEVEVGSYAVFKFTPYDIALANKISEVIVDEDLDILHAHYAVPHAICSALGRDMAGVQIPIITTLHGTDVTILGHDRTLSGTVKYGINKSDMTTAVSHSLKEETYELIRPAKEIRTIYNFIDERHYRPVNAHHMKAGLGLAESDKIVIHVSNFRKVKRIEDVVRSFAIINREVPSKLLLVGDGPEVESIHTLVSEEGLGTEVLFLGKRDDLPDLFSISDLNMLVSEKEAFGLVLIEAMACGVPCVGSDIGGIPEVIEDGKNGFIRPLGDIEGYAEAAIRILKDPELASRFSKEAIRSVRERFSSERIVMEYESAYYELLERKEP
ncbi:N-acetyl-alpha-D-glucosaminyl L-malate synthase BshA [Bhargavaea beijingensis]|uniref:N-acetyl-alpha-D-glucosaminyl L-malate synthase BshA n=1 Tax=Bhargavaea beijingensis TaxID=426756 RepID=A0A1G7AK39_9BACL|nr:N-acetyl-alpha-D-glucosaminyl L-malate synthase BshA [Bhargavaea beijingensis]MCW1928167.1 N-acetyl-alpha-D-glucosaminyl L-malate synthase BshA [Bhargavaea beijingensis]RSK24845.1 N-acetyl-alpha-D-glucosaminyl L-malate synthase BshA [Bhargavaea beijingensis]SDE15113.1 N-acetyl-alpha-D-glucosaminyl L-malate synthase BshA [Bhargavaea beijingensis]